jgi:hypothetical protein
MNWKPLDYSDCKSHADIDAKMYTSLFVLAVFAIVLFTAINL